MTEFRTKLNCWGKNKTFQTFDMKAVREDSGWKIQVDTDPPAPGGPFTAEYMFLAPGRLRSILMEHWKQPVFSGKGIPDAVLFFMGCELGYAVESSPGIAPKGLPGQPGVWMNSDSLAVWQRLEKSSQARLLDSATLTYELTLQGKCSPRTAP
jgi:hypothetical protein